MLNKLLAEKRELVEHASFLFLPMTYALANLKVYRDYLSEYRQANIQSLEDEISLASWQPIELIVDLENGSTHTVVTSEHELAIDYYEDEYGGNTHLFNTFLLEGFIYKNHQQLDWIVRKWCAIAEKYSGQSFEAFASSFKKKAKDAPLLMIRGVYLQNILSPQNDPARGQFKDFVTELERVSIVRNCVTHEDNAIDNFQFVPKLKQFFQNNKCGSIEDRGNRKIIHLNYQYPDYLIDLLERLIPFMLGKIVAWLSR